jgi:hypothetical protein
MGVGQEMGQLTTPTETTVPMALHLYLKFLHSLLPVLVLLFFLLMLVLPGLLAPVVVDQTVLLVLLDEFLYFINTQDIL